MIKNVLLKNILINTVFKGLSLVNRIVPKDDKKVLLYSDERFCDNILYLYRYLRENGYHKDYELICAAKVFTGGTDRDEGVRFVKPGRAVLDYLRCGHVFYCFGRLPIQPVEGKQTVIQMWHGTSFKGFASNQVKTNSLKNQFYTYVYAGSDFFVPMTARKFAVPEDKIRICGHPRTDVFMSGREAPDYFGSCRKLVAWLPTFRHSHELGMTDGDPGIVIPVLKKEEMSAFNDYLARRDIKVVVKLHPSQDIPAWGPGAMSNLIIMTDAEFTGRGIDLYEMLKGSDAMITDYSSVIYDYLLLDRPIGFTEDDLDEYRGSRGFAVDVDRFRPGMRIRTCDDLMRFIDSLEETGENDKYREAREELNDLVNHYQDGKNSLRTVRLSGMREPDAGKPER